jgi:phenylacetate-coenzyme A ligase PaaK-like adenylate-forming protein
MKFIGRLVKQTAKLEYKRSLKKDLSFGLQIDTLLKLVKTAKRTSLGKSYHFSSMLNETGIIESFQNNVPIQHYDEFYQSWLKDTIAGKKNVIWPGKINHFALSSGTTGSPSKQIPITKQMIKSFQKTSLKQIVTLCQLDLPTEFFQKQVLVVGGSSKLTKIQKRFEGDLSGILKKHTKKIATPFTKPSKKISDIKDWKLKLERIVEEAPTWDIGIIAGIPSWCVLVMEEIVKHYELNSIHEMWPNLKVYIHGGIFIEPYEKRLENVCNKPLYQFDTYLASEGYFAYQLDEKEKVMRLLIDNGVFFEFIPFNSHYFDSNGNLIDKYKAYTLQDVEEGIDYAMVITTNAGLWRYQLGDTIRFTNVAKREIKITGRTKQYLSLAGEHLSLDNIRVALTKVSQELNIVIEEFTVFAEEEHSKHSWYIGTDKQIDTNLLQSCLDQQLALLNDDYKSARKNTLGAPEINLISSDLFYQFLASIGKLGAQNKFPRIIRGNQKNSWLEFLKNN